MKLISDKDLHISWDDVCDVLAGIMLVLSRCFKHIDGVPVWIFLLVALFAIGLGVVEFVKFRKRKKNGRRRSYGFAFRILFVLWGISFVVKAFSLL